MGGIAQGDRRETADSAEYFFVFNYLRYLLALFLKYLQ